MPVATVAPGLGNLQFVKPLGEAAKELQKTLQGFFFFFVIAALVLFVIALGASGPAERPYVVGGAFLLLVLALLSYFLAIPRISKVVAATESAKTEAAAAKQIVGSAMPAQLAEPPVSIESASSRPGTLTAPDGTFVFSKPGAHWVYRETSLPEIMAEAMAAQGLPFDRTEVERRIPYRPGPVVSLTHAKRHRLNYSPETRWNGRPVLGLMEENFPATVLIYSVGRRGVTVSDITPEHLFALQLGEAAQMGFRVSEITRVELPAEQDRVLAAHAAQSFQRVEVDGAGPVDITLQIRLHVVARGYFLYVVRAIWLTGVPGQTEIEAEIDSIIGSVQATNAASAEDRAKRDAASADAKFDDILEQIAEPVLASRLRTMLEATVTPDGGVKFDPAIGARIRKLLDYARADSIRPLLSDGFVEVLAQCTAAFDAAGAGDFAPLHRLAAEITGAEEEADEPAPDGYPDRAAPSPHRPPALDGAAA